MWKLKETKLLPALFPLMVIWFCLFSTPMAGTLGSAEYFIDTDPGTGNANALPAADGSFDGMIEQLLKTGIPSQELPVGDHVIGVRARDSYGVWGVTRKITFKVVDSNPYKRITAAEYFIDTDPGHSKGKPLPPTDGMFDTPLDSARLANVPTGELSPGGHTIFARFKDNCGYYPQKFDGWGPAKGQTLCVVEIPVLDSPPNGADIGPSVVLKWSRLDAVSAYEVILIDRDSASGSLKDTVPADQDSVLIEHLARDHRYWWKIRGMYTCGSSWSDSSGFHVPATAVYEVNVAEHLPRDYSLSQNYPNPFNPSTQIVFALPRPSSVTLTIYNTLGQIVRILASERIATGNWSVCWDGRNDGGKDVASGIYFYRLSAGDFVDTRKMILLK